MTITQDIRDMLTVCTQAGVCCSIPPTNPTAKQCVEAGLLSREVLGIMHTIYSITPGGLELMYGGAQVVHP